MLRISKTLLSTLLCGTLLLSPALAFYGEGPSEWARTEVRAAYDSALPSWEDAWIPATLQGLTENPYVDRIWRNEFCHLLAAVYAKDKNLSTPRQLEALEKMGYTTPFTDLHRVNWNYEIWMLHALKIVDGVRADKFEPFSMLTREQAAKLLANALRVLRPDRPQTAPVAAFRDRDSIADWAKSDVDFVVAQGLMKGMEDGGFYPQGGFTTEQAIVTCYRLCQILEVPQLISADQANVWLDEHHMNRNVQGSFGDLAVSYGGAANGIAKMKVQEISVEGVGVLEPSDKDWTRPENNESAGYLAQGFGMLYGRLEEDSYHTAQVTLQLTLKDGTTQTRTDRFVFLY